MATDDSVQPDNSGGDSSTSDWFQQNSPPASAVTPDQVAALYQQYLGRAPENAQVVQSYINGLGATGGLAAIQAAIQSSPEAQAYAKANPPAAAASSTSYSDPYTMINALLKQGVDPASAVDQVNTKFNLTAQGQGLEYYPAGAHGAGSGAVVGLPSSVNGGGYLAPDASGNWGYNVGDSKGGGSTLSGIGSYTPPAAPVYTPYNPGPAPTPTPYTAPTEAQAQATPGYQFAVDQGNLALQRSAAAQGGLLSGGALKDISAYNTGMADQNYNTLVGQGLAINAQNNGQALNAYTAGAGANTAAGGLNLSGVNSQFNNTYTPSWNAYLSNVGQSQFGQQFGLQQQGQFWNQGLEANQNAYNQYSNNQNTSFQQWYQNALLGNPGNPYT